MGEIAGQPIDPDERFRIAMARYFDQLSFARQVGMLPPEKSLRDRLLTGAFNLSARARRRLRR